MKEYMSQEEFWTDEEAMRKEYMYQVEFMDEIDEEFYRNMLEEAGWYDDEEIEDGDFWDHVFDDADTPEQELAIMREMLDIYEILTSPEDEASPDKVSQP